MHTSFSPAFFLRGLYRNGKMSDSLATWLAFDSLGPKMLEMCDLGGFGDPRRQKGGPIFFPAQ
jgi:hypothetical protein